MDDFGLKREPEKEISRRDFFRGVAAGMAGGVLISAGGFVICLEFQPETEPGVIRIGTATILGFLAIYLIRHCETECVFGSRHTGLTDIPLNQAQPQRRTA